MDSKRVGRCVVSYEVNAERGRRFVEYWPLVSDNESSDNKGIWLVRGGEANLYGRDFFLNWIDDEQLFAIDDADEEVVDDKSLIGDDDTPSVAFDFEWRPINKPNDKILNKKKKPWSA